jgi:hypothetical protein
MHKKIGISLVLLVTSFPFSVIAQPNPKLPSICVPKQVGRVQTKKVSLRDLTFYKGSTYFFLVVSGSYRNSETPSIVRYDGHRCFLSYVDVGEGASMSTGVPRPVAEVFASRAIDIIIKSKGGIVAYQKWFTTQNFTQVTPEDAIALRRYKIKMSPKAG